jgi:hypothetical protein
MLLSSLRNSKECAKKTERALYPNRAKLSAPGQTALLTAGRDDRAGSGMDNTHYHTLSINPLNLLSIYHPSRQTTHTGRIHHVQ